MTSPATQTINSIEELTMFSIDRTLDGLDALSLDCQRCATAVENNPAGSVSQLTTLAVNIHDFDIFQTNLSSFFFIDSDVIGDFKGTLKIAEDEFHETLNEMAVLLSAGNMTGLIRLLKDDIPDRLARFRELFPLLRDHIHDEYLQPAG